MTHKDFDGDQLENLMKNAPKLPDSRSKEDVLNRLLADARLQDNTHLQAAIDEPIEPIEIPQEQRQQTASIQEERAVVAKRSRKNSKIPVFISIASVFVLTLLVGMIMNNNSTGDKESIKAESYSTVQTDEAESVEKANALMDKDAFVNDTRMMSLRTSVYEEDLTEATALRIGLASSAAESVPVTFVIPNERVVADFGDVKPTTLQLYEKYAPQIDEEAMGFAEYHPYKGELKEQGETLVHVLPEENEYDGASATVNMYTGSLKDTFSDYKEVAVKTAEGKAYEFSQVGEPSEPIQMTGIVNHYNYYLLKEKNGVEYLSPNFRETFETVTEALQGMHLKKDDIYVPVVPEKVTFAVTEAKDGVIVTFDTPLDLTVLGAVQATQLVEAMMLTAASFDQQLRLENLVQDSWEGFNFNEYLPMPMGANKQYMQ
ncbi:RNA polymerase subunit sigma [Lysinibacillus sp. NPDC096418]|uniref:RNA polymerase subunit sigma n=1 Tax=Lysinibacillus sp. NPDC096418 TaxID=3364138 RepID=UPI003817758B